MSMRIRLLSDLHLETGPFTWEDQGEDVVVLAGDIGVGVTGIEWAKTIPKPVIYVAGNHEHYGQDIYDNIKAMRACAKGSNVHYLENNAVLLTVNGETVRFLGCTLWTDFGAAHCEKHPVVLLNDHNPQHALMQHALGWMNDYRNITAAKWWSKKNEQRYESILHVNIDNKCFSPLAAFDVHKKSKKWLTNKLKNECEHKTVVVTHHAPSYQSLKQAGMINNDHALNQRRWSPSRRDEIGLYRVAAYASDLEDLLKRRSWSGSGVDLWLHGHLHSRIEYALGGAVVSCNPRGYHQKPLTQKEIKGYALLGYPVSDGSLERSEKTFAENPERGDTLSFERNLLINTDTALEELVLIKSREMLKDLAPLLHDVNAHLHYLKHKDEVIVKLIGEHIARKAEQFNGGVKKILDYLHIALKSKCLDNESNYWSAVGLGLTENYVHLKSQKAKKSVLNFRVEADLNYSRYTAKPSEWGMKVIKDMQKTIRGFDERLEKCVRELAK